MLAEVPPRVPGARIEGLLVTPMAGEGVELIAGTRIDPVFGPMVMIGLGGIFAEVLRDVVLAPAPVGADQARAMLARLKGRALLEGARGRPPADLGAVAETIARLSVLAADHAETVESIEINPLLATPQGALALDALILPRKDA